jgi:hypothetical protein
MRIGEILIEQGVLTRDQVERALAAQRESSEPFGIVCERLFGLHPKVVEGAWAEQYAALVARVDPKLDQIDDEAEAVVTRRQAWQFRVAPLRFETEVDGALVLATCVEALPRALRFATTHIAHPVFFVLVPAETLANHLQARFPMLGMDAEIVRRGFRVA